MSRADGRRAMKRAPLRVLTVYFAIIERSDSWGSQPALIEFSFVLRRSPPRPAKGLSLRGSKVISSLYKKDKAMGLSGDTPR